jgi:holliday junction DNA helicase RuvA
MLPMHWQWPCAIITAATGLRLNRSMIDFITGVLIEKNPGRVIVQSSGIGYSLQISMNTFEHLPQHGEQVNLKTYLHVREDNIQLFAFSQEVERKVFLGLISVSGIGPKMAQGILSGIKVYELIQAIQHGDEPRLTSISGVGKKTAQRLIVELREKFTQMGLLGDQTVPEYRSVQLNRVEEETALALLSLGYKKQSVEKALLKVRAEGDLQSVEELLKRALKVI